MRKILALLCLMLPAGAAAAEPLRITVFGDSLVQGYGLPQEQGLVPQLERWLNENGAEVQLQNAGVSGDTTAGGAARVEWTLSDAPDGLIVLLGGNDMLRGLPPSEARTNLSNILQQATGSGIETLLVGMTAPGNYGPDYKTEFDAIYPDLAGRFDAVLHPDAFGGIAEKADGDISAAQVYFQPDGIHPNAEGVALNVAALGPAALQLIERIQN